MVAFSLSIIFCNSECALIDFRIRLAAGTVGTVASPSNAIANGDALR